eukprot:CAMPEP_0170099682 /NCGR_PEP_ID=MMETSP0020_2-20130122/1186_1 /TAXON_ID=98059 /ORGANISM="Dinobryon sp., Strain UTEXLB2267" /LENGTH=2317 /DNA_ID=CAMNT_0010322389 /DNA_START=216 /DNA_END=7169 /DNA_ORIENTATION=+
MEKDAQEYLMQVIKEYVDMMLEASSNAVDIDPADDDAETKFCKYCAIKDQYITELRSKLTDELIKEASSGNSLSVAMEDAMVVTLKESEQKTAELTESIKAMTDKLESANQRIRELDTLCMEKDGLILQQGEDLHELQYQLDEVQQVLAKAEEKLRAAEDEVELFKPKADRVDLTEAQLDRLRFKLVTFNEMKQQLKDEQDNHSVTFSKLVSCEKELADFKELCAQLEDYRGQCADSNVLIEELRLQLGDRDDDVLRLKSEKMTIDREAKEAAFRMQLLEEELNVVSERLANFEKVGSGGMGDAIHELNPMIMSELKKLRSENKELREKNMRSSAQEFEKLERELAEEKQMSSAMHSKWLSTKESHDFLKQKLESSHGFEAGLALDEEEIRDIRKQYEIELIRVRSKLHDTEVKLDAYTNKSSSAYDYSSHENVKKYEYEIMELKAKLADAENKINELMDTNKLQETILNSSKEEGLIATRRAHEIEINGLRSALAEAQSKVNDLSVANKVQETMMNSSVVEHNEARKHLEVEMASMKTTIAESQSKINELTVINKVQENALVSNKEDIANVKKQYEIETNHLKSVYAEAKAKIAELNDSLRALSAARNYNPEEERARKLLEDEVNSLKSALSAAQSKANDLVVANKVLDSALAVAKGDLHQYKELSQQETSNLKIALSAAQVKVNELSVSNKVNENSSNLNESTVLSLRSELAECKKYYDLELRSTKKALQEAQNKIHELIHVQMRHETDSKSSGSDQDLVPAIKGHFESEINQLKGALLTAQEKINDLTVIIRVHEHALTTAKEELAISKQQHDVDINQSKFTVEVLQNKIKVLEDSNRRQEDSLKSSLAFQSDRNDDVSTNAQDASRRYFEQENDRLKASLKELERRLEHVSLTLIEKDRVVGDLTLQNKIQESMLLGAKEKLEEIKAHSDAELQSLRSHLSTTQLALNEALISNKVQDNLLSSMKADMATLKENYESDTGMYRKRVAELSLKLDELSEANNRYSLESNTTFIEEEVLRLKSALEDAHRNESALQSDNIEAFSRCNEMRAEIDRNEMTISILSENIRAADLKSNSEIGRLKSELLEAKDLHQKLTVNYTVVMKLMDESKKEIESLKTASVNEIKVLQAELTNSRQQLEESLANMSVQDLSLTALKAELVGAQEALQLSQVEAAKLSSAKSDLELVLQAARNEVDALKQSLETAEAIHSAKLPPPHRKPNTELANEASRHSESAKQSDGRLMAEQKQAQPTHQRRGSKTLSKTDDGDEDDDDIFGTLPIFDFQVVQLQTSLADSKGKADKLTQSLEEKERLINELTCDKRIIESQLETCKEDLAATKQRTNDVIALLKSQSEEAQKKIMDLNAELGIKAEQHQRLETVIEKMSLDLKHLTSTLQQEEEKVVDLSVKNKLAETAIESLQADLKHLLEDKTQGTSIELEAAEAKILELTELLEKQSNVLSGTKDGTESDDQVKQLELDILSLTSSLNDCHSKSKELLLSNQSQERSILALQAELTTTKESFKATDAEAQKKIVDIAAAKAILESDIRKCNVMINELKKKCDDEVNDKRAIIAANQTKINDLQASLKISENRLADAKKDISALNEKCLNIDIGSKLHDVDLKNLLADTKLKLSEVSTELSLRVLELAKSVQLREEQEKQHLEDIREMQKKHDVDIQNNSISVRDHVKAKVEKYLDEVTEEKENLSAQLESANAALVEAKKQYEAAELTILSLQENKEGVLLQSSAASTLEIELLQQKTKELTKAMNDLLEERANLTESRKSAETALANTKRELEEQLKLRDSFLKQHNESELEMKAQYNIVVQRESMALRELEQTKKFYDLETVQLKEHLSDAQNRLKDLTSANKVMEDELRASKEELSILRVKKEGDSHMTKAALMEAQNKLLEFQHANDRQREELTACKKELDNVLQSQSVLEAQHKNEIESVTLNIKEQMKAKVEEYVKELHDDTDKHLKNLRVSQTEIALLHRKLEAAHVEIDRLNALLLNTSSAYPQSPPVVATAVTSPPSQQNLQTPARKGTPFTTEQINIAAKIEDPDQEALEAGILLSRQEAEFGTNMFDSLKPEDATVIQEYTKQGFSREEAILMIFEHKYGKMSNTNNEIMSMPRILHEPSSHLAPTATGHPSIQKTANLVQRMLIRPNSNTANLPPAGILKHPPTADRQLHRSGSNNSGSTTNSLDEAELAQIMSRGYNREQAAQIYQSTPVRRGSKTLPQPDQLPPRGIISPNSSIGSRSLSRVGSHTELLDMQQPPPAQPSNNPMGGKSQLTDDDMFAVAMLMKNNKIDRQQAIQVVLKQKGVHF